MEAHPRNSEKHVGTYIEYSVRAILQSKQGENSIHAGPEKQVKGNLFCCNRESKYSGNRVHASPEEQLQ